LLYGKIQVQFLLVKLSFLTEFLLWLHVGYWQFLI